MFSDTEKEAIRRTWRLVVPIAETAADLFYKRLFELRPSYRALFPEELSSQKKKLVRMLAFVVKSLDWAESAWRDDVPPSEDLMLVVLALGRRHSELYRIPEDSYGPVGEALLWTLDQGLADAFTSEVRAAWTHIYTLLAQTMRMGSAVVDREGALSGAAPASEQGETALLTQQLAMGIDDAMLGIAEDPS